MPTNSNNTLKVRQCYREILPIPEWIAAACYNNALTRGSMFILAQGGILIIEGIKGPA